MKATKFSLLGLLALLFVFTACEDDFSEQDLLELQAELAETKAQNDFQRRLDELAAMAEDAQELATLNDVLARATAEYLALLNEALQDEDDSLRAVAALEALRSAGFIVQYDVETVVDDAPVQGVVVTLESASGIVSDTTDVAGIVTFLDVPVGINQVVVDGTNYLPITYDINFGTPTDNIEFYDLDGGGTGANLVYAEPKFGKSTITLVASASITGAATISGFVSGDVNLTNNTEEDLANLPVVASINTIGGNNNETADRALITTVGSFTGATTSVSTVSFDIDGFSMTDSTSATGAYSIMVPASEDLIFNYRIEFPNQVLGNQFAATVDANGAASVVSIPAVWGYNLDGTRVSGGSRTAIAGGAGFSTNLPRIRGYQHNLAAAPTYGTGFSIVVTDTVERGIGANDAGLKTEIDQMLGLGSGVRADIENFGGNPATIATKTNPGTLTRFTPTATFTGGTGTAPTVYFQQDLRWLQAAPTATNSAAITITNATAARYTPGSNYGSLYIEIIGANKLNTTDIDTLLIEIDAVVTDDGDGIMEAAEFSNGAANFVSGTALVLNNQNYTVYRSNDNVNAGESFSTGTGATTVGYTNTGNTWNPSNVYSIDGVYDMNITAMSVELLETAGSVAAGAPANDGGTFADNFATAGRIAVSNLQVDNVTTINPGAYRTAPTRMTLSNGAIFDINAFAFQYEFRISSVGGSGYEVVPPTITYAGQQWNSINVTATNALESVIQLDGANVVNTDGGAGFGDLSDLLTVVNDTLSEYNANVDEFRTNEWLTAPPTLNPITQTVVDHMAAITLTANGSVTSANITPGNDYNSAPTSFTLEGRNIVATATGAGTVTTAPTTAAVFSLAGVTSTTNNRTKIVTLGGDTNLNSATEVTNRGLGYIANINRTTRPDLRFFNNTATITQSATDISATFSVRPNQAYELDFSYGIGQLQDREVQYESEF